MKDCTDLNIDEALDLFNATFPDYPFVNESQRELIKKKKQDLQHLVIVDEEIADWLDLPDNLDYAVYSKNLGAPFELLTILSPITYKLHPNQELFGSFTNSVNVSSDFRGFLANEHWIIYVGDNYSFYCTPDLVRARDTSPQHFGWEVDPLTFRLTGKSGVREWVIFSDVDGKSNDMVDMTDMICGSPHQFTFMNWNKDNPLEVKE